MENEEKSTPCAADNAVQPVEPEKTVPETIQEPAPVQEPAPAEEENAEEPVKEEAVKEETPERPPRPRIEVTQQMLDDSVQRLSVMLDYLGLEGTVKAEKRNSKINLLIASSDAGRIIGRKGQSLESLQLLLNRMMQRGNVDFPKIYIDIDGYSSKGGIPPEDGEGRREERRPRRPRGERPERTERPERGERSERGPRRGGEGDKEEVLRQQALDSAKEVKRWGEPVTLPPMNSHDRRIVHITLEDSTEVITESVGDGAMKSVVISLKK